MNAILSKKSTKKGKDCVKSVNIRSFFGLYFPTFGLNTEKIQETPITDTFHAAKGK